MDRRVGWLSALLLAVACTAAAAEPGDAALEARLEEKLAERRRLAIALAELHLAAGNLERATDHYEMARRILDDDVQLLSRLMQLYRQSGDDRRLLAVTQRLVELQPTSIGWHRELGSCYFRLGDRGKAEAAWRKILEVYPNRASALRFLAQTYAQHGLADQALATYREAVEANPADEYARLELGEALGQARQHLEALAVVAPLKLGASSLHRRRATTVKHQAFFELDLTRPVRAAVERLLDGKEHSAADFAWAIAQAFEASDEPKRAAEFYRRVAEAEPKTDRGKAAAAKARELAPKP